VHSYSGAKWEKVGQLDTGRFFHRLLPGPESTLLIVAGAIFGFALGTYFSVAMVALAGASILYDTSNVLHHYPEDRYVGAALQLFASVAMMLWYVLRIFLSRR
jgi:FtsH-binding integral membrane protein